MSDLNHPEFAGDITSTHFRCTTAGNWGFGVIKEDALRMKLALRVHLFRKQDLHPGTPGP